MKYMNFDDLQKLGQHNVDTAMKLSGEWNKGLQAIAAEMTDYTKRSFEEQPSRPARQSPNDNHAPRRVESTLNQSEHGKGPDADGTRGLTGLFGSPLLGHEQAVSMQMPSAGGERLDGMSVPRGSRRGAKGPGQRGLPARKVDSRGASFGEGSSA